jgi:hypothetical protein
MSPEQARGRTVDKRADIWAFGLVLYEMLTGRAAFAGDTTTDVLAAIVTREPDWTVLPVATPASVRRLLARCLEKDPKRRLRDIGEARLEIEESTARGSVQAPAANAGSVPPPAGAARVQKIVWALAGVALGAIAIGARSACRSCTPREAKSAGPQFRPTAGVWRIARDGAMACHCCGCATC